MRFWDAAIWTNDDRARAMVLKDVALPDRDYLRLGVESVASAELLGTCSLWSINAQSRRDSAMFGLLRRDWYQKGEALAATEA